MGSFLHVKLAPGERIFALSEGEKRTRIFVIVRSERDSEFRVREMIDLAGWTGIDSYPWLMSDVIPMTLDTYEDLTASDSAAPILETFPRFPEAGKVEVYLRGSNLSYEKTAQDTKTIAPKVIGWLARFSTLGRSFDLFLTKGWNNFEYGLAAVQVEETGTSIPVRDRNYLIKSLKLSVPGNWDGKTTAPHCPHCKAPSPHLHNGLEGDDRSYRCNTCSEDFQAEEGKRKRRSSV